MRLLFLLLLPVFSQAQIPNKANTIVVKGVTFDEVCSALLDKGYFIEKKNEGLGTVKTEIRVYPKRYNAAYIVNVRIKDSAAYFSGTFTAPYEQPFTSAASKMEPLWNNDPVVATVNKKGELNAKSLQGYPFSLIDELAKSFGRPVEYLKQ